MYESNDRNVSHPIHYASSSGLECIEVINAVTEGLEGIEAVCTAQVIKYIWRWKKKNGVQDLEKAKWYLTYLIDRIKPEEKMEKSLDINNSEDLQILASVEMCGEKADQVTEAIDWYFDKYGHMSIANLLFVIGIPGVDAETSCAYGWNDRSDVYARKSFMYEPPVCRLEFKDPIYLGEEEN